MKNRLNLETERQAQLILDEIEKMEAAGILPFSDTCGDDTVVVDGAGLRKTIEELRTTSITIAVCGVVKAGKSTFLNSILFGRDVLPTFPTPCTTKLTFITHTTGRTGFHVDFFTREEYDAMKAKMPEAVRQEQESRETRSINAGVSPSGLWGLGRDGSGDNAFTELQEYVAQDGRYVPFVKQVTLLINRPELESLTIVDTPGLDDPNPLNSYVTERWAEKAHAVVYLMPWKGIGLEDKKFIERNFGKLSQKSINRVFVITKIDDNPDWVSTLAKFKSDFPEERDNVCGYSSYINLLRQRAARGERLSEDEDDELAVLGEDFNPDPGRVTKLIARRLYQGGFEMKVQKCVNLIRGYYVRYAKKQQLAIANLDVTVKNYERSYEEARDVLERLRRCRDELNRTIVAIGKDVKNKIRGIDDINKRLEPIIERISRKADQQIDKSNRDDQVIPNTEIAVGRANLTLRASIEEILNGYLSDTECVIDGIRNDIRVAVEGSGCEDEIVEPELYQINDYRSELIAALDVSIDAAKVKEEITFWCKTETNCTQAKSAFAKALSTAAGQAIAAAGKFNRKCRAVMDAYVRRTCGEVDERIAESFRSQSAGPKERKKLFDAAVAQREQVKAKLRRAEEAEASCCV